MPYSRNSDMPGSITDNVSDAGQTIMRNVINSQLERGLSETRAFASAWAALSRAGYSRGEDGKWAKGSSPGSDSETDKMSPTPSDVHVSSTDWNRDRRRRTRKELSASARSALENKVTDHNAEHGDKGRVSLPMLEQVYNRGVGAYRTNPGSVRPSVNSPEQWAMARVNNFLRTIRTGRFRSGKHDTDLLPSKHPLSTRKGLPEGVEKAEYQGREVELDRPFRLPSGSSKKFGVYVKDGDDVRRVTFGSPDMEIRRDDPEARANFRARHSCDTASDKTSARWWSCRMWEPDVTVSEVLSKEEARYEAISHAVPLRELREIAGSAQRLAKEVGQVFKKLDLQKLQQPKDASASEHKARDVWDACIHFMAKNEGQVSKPEASLLRFIRGEGDQLLLGMGELRAILQRHGASSGRPFLGQDRQRKRLQQRELSMDSEARSAEASQVLQDAIHSSVRLIEKRQIVEDVYTTPAEARTRSLELGFMDGAIHVHNTSDGTAAYMPGPDHEAYNRAIEARAGIYDNDADEYSDDDDSEYQSGSERESEDQEHSMSGRVANLLESVASLLKSGDTDPDFFRPDATRSNGQGEAHETHVEATGIELSGTILKADDDERIVWGWASVVTEKGVPVVDKQGDVISPEEISKAATEFMLDVRVAKAMHQGDQVGHVVHSFPLTNELAKALGIQSDREGWIIAQKITDDDVWARVKSGELSAFSIGGNAISEEINEGSDDD